ncbi:MAG TPA: CHAT domain-containing protein [Longimicrobium sp.]
MGYRSNRAPSASVRPASASGSAPIRRTSRLAVVAVFCAAAASACGAAHGDDAPQGLLGELAREMGAAPAITARLSISPARPPAASAARAPSPRISRIAARAAQGVRDSADTGAMHAAALIDLLFDGGGGKSLQRSISSLRTAAGLAERPAPVLADLAAAYLVRWERDHTPRDLVAAIEAAEEALEREPGNAAARYNLALALERLGLVDEVAQGWRAYLAADSTSRWAGAARRHLRQVLAIPRESAPPAAGAPLPAWSAYAAAEPQRAREMGWCRVLGDWARAALEGDAAAAEAHLRRAEVLGAALERRPGGDATLVDGVRAIRARAGAAEAERLAGAHRDFAEGCELDRRVNFGAAAQKFASADAAAEGSPTLRAWARLLHGGAVFHGGEPGRGGAILRRVAAEADSVRHPALAGRARQLLGALLMRGDGYDSATAQARMASRLFARAGEREGEGGTLEALAVGQFGYQDVEQGWAFAHQALERLRSYRRSYRLHNLLATVAGFAADDGFPRAAVRIQEEGVRVAERTGEPAYLAEARLSLALLHATAGAGAAAGRDVAAADAAVKEMKEVDPKVQGWMAARRQMAVAPVRLRADPGGVAGALDSATAFFLDEMDAPLLAFPAMVDGAEARLAAGDAAGGTARLEAALAVLEQRRNSIRMELRRAAVFEEARALVDRATMLMLASGRTRDALRYLDRGRASLATVGAEVPVDAGRGAPAGRAGEVALAYAMVGDTLLAWTVAGERVELHRATLDTARLVREVERLRQQLEEGAGEAELRPGLSQLYEWLVRPLEGRLGGAGTPLVVVADGPLGSVPFAALLDARRGRYVVEDHPLRFAASLREAWRPVRRAGAGAASLFVADPAFDARRHPGFPRLAEAAEEARQIASGYPRPRVLSDAAANGEAMRAELRRAGLVHYAGHAVFDDERPERSYLLLAPAPGGGAAATLQAGEIAEMDLRHLSLVVLAACQTVRTGPGRAAGFSGLAGAFLAAGAGGAVGSLWQVDDRLTRPLMIEFHRAYRAAPNGPGALRAAQLRLLRSGDPALRSPAAWAGFRYAGS